MWTLWSFCDREGGFMERGSVAELEPWTTETVRWLYGSPPLFVFFSLWTFWRKGSYNKAAEAGERCLSSTEEVWADTAMLFFIVSTPAFPPQPCFSTRFHLFYFLFWCSYVFMQILNTLETVGWEHTSCTCYTAYHFLICCFIMSTFIWHLCVTSAVNDIKPITVWKL